MLTEINRYAQPHGFQPEQNSWEEWVCGASPHEPGVLLRMEQNSDSFTATSALNLVGISDRATPDEWPSETGGRIESRGGDLLGLLLSNMNAGHQVKIVYSSEPDAHGDSRFSLQVFHSLRAPDADQATEKIRRRWQELIPLLSALAHDYSFAPAPLSDVRAATRQDAWCAKLRPRGMLLNITARQGIGFTATRDNDSASGRMKQPAVIALTLPGHDGRSPDYDGIARGVSGCAAAIKVSLIFEPFRLRPHHLHFLRAATSALWNNSARLFNPSAEQAEDLLDAENRSYLQGVFAQWAREPEGYRMSCFVSAAEPPPVSLVKFLGREIFQSDSVSAQQMECVADDEQRIDLRGALNRMSPMPSPFPSSRFLNEVGVKRFFAGVPAELPHGGILLGHAGRQDCRKEVRFAPNDRACHSYVVGATGGGKSTLLYNMIAQDMQNGDGVALIDPHGDLYQAVLSSVPAHRADDVVLIDCCDFERVVGLNFLECQHPYRHQQMNFISNEVIKIFDQLYDLEKTGGPVFEQYMRNALLLAMDNETRNATLLDIPLLFEDADYRRTLINGCRNPIVADFWSKQAERAGGEMALHNIAPYITSKLNQFTSNALLRPMIGQANSTIDFRELVDRKQILLVNLAKGSLGEMDTRLLGMLIMGKLFCAALGRADVPTSSRHPFYLYVDEFQNFTTETVANLLSEARKYGLHLTLANQNLAQLSALQSRQSILDAVLGNCGSLFLFRQGAIDAQYMQAYTTPYLKAQDLQELQAYHVAAKLLCNKRPSRPFVFQTLPPLDANRSLADIDALINISKQKYARPVFEAERVICERKAVSNYA